MFERQLPHENLNRAIADAMRAANMTPGGPATAPQFATSTASVAAALDVSREATAVE